MKSKKFYKNNKSGFVLLYAVLVAMVVVTVGVLMANIVTRQIVLSSVSRNSQISYYAANAGYGCAYHYYAKGLWGVQDFGSFTPPVDPLIVECLGSNEVLNLSNLNSPDYFYEWSFVVDGKSCVDVEVSRDLDGNDFRIIAKGYNVSSLDSNNKCDISNFPRLTERIIDIRP